jgi:hypothetical protein
VAKLQVSASAAQHWGFPIASGSGGGGEDAELARQPSWHALGRACGSLSENAHLSGTALSVAAAARAPLQPLATTSALDGTLVRGIRDLTVFSSLQVVHCCVYFETNRLAFSGKWRS